MGCDYTIHIGEIPVKPDQKMGFVHLALGISVAEIIYEKALDQPHFTIGETSFLKAQLAQDRATYIAMPIEKLLQVIPEYQSGKTKVIDDAMISVVREAVSAPNMTGYHMRMNLHELPKFLEEHKGKPCYSICW